MLLAIEVRDINTRYAFIMDRKPFERRSRVAVEIQRTISELLRKDIADPRLKNVTITDVKVSKDLRIAKVYFSVYTEKESIQSTIDGFFSAKKYIKRELASRLSLRYMPEIMFFHDKSFDYGAHMDRVFKSI